MVSRAPGAAQTPKIGDFRPAQKSCIKNPKCSNTRSPWGDGADCGVHDGASGGADDGAAFAELLVFDGLSKLLRKHSKAGEALRSFAKASFKRETYRNIKI